jgi:hypothetical protein
LIGTMGVSYPFLAIALAFRSGSIINDTLIAT